VGFLLRSASDALHAISIDYATLEGPAKKMRDRPGGKLLLAFTSLAGNRGLAKLVA